MKSSTKKLKKYEVFFHFLHGISIWKDKSSIGSWQYFSPMELIWSFFRDFFGTFLKFYKCCRKCSLNRFYNLLFELNKNIFYNDNFLFNSHMETKVSQIMKFDFYTPKKSRELYLIFFFQISKRVIIICW